MEYRFVQIPLPGDYCERIEALLRENGVFLTNGKNHKNPYVMSEYLNADVQIHAHIDRNILSHIIDLVRGRTHVSTQHEPQMLKLAAACWTFWGVVDACFHSTWGTYEYGWTQGHDRALKSLQWFKHAVGIEPRYYAAVALGDLSPQEFADLFPAEDDLPEYETGEFERRLRNWKASYWTVLKVAQLQRSSLKPDEKLRDLADWMVDDAVLNIFGLVLAVIGFSPESEFGFLEGMRTSDPERLRARISNVAWDLAHLRGWSQACRDCSRSEIWIFASLDRGLRHLGGFCFSFREEDERLSDQEMLFRRHWGARWRAIRDLIRSREDRALGETRDRIVESRISTMDESIRDLEVSLSLAR